MTPVKTRDTVIDKKQVVDLIRETQGSKTLRDFGDEVGVSASYISEIYKGTRNPGVKILDYFGITKSTRTIVEYRLAKK
jgi:transcriptional regulator with XRE-family HTH domain